MARKKSRPSKAKAPLSGKPLSTHTAAPASLPAVANGNGAAENGTGNGLSEAIQDSPDPIHRDAAAGNGAATAITTAPRTQTAAGAKPPEDGSADWSAWGKKAANILGSLQLAVILLSIFASVVFLGTLMEHYYSTQIAQELVYRAWWFNFLLFMLASTIFFAAAKKARFTSEPLQLQPVTATTFFGKVRGYWDQTYYTVAHFWPWKRHQFGFIVTHIGLITMLAGGLVNNYFGTDALMQLLDNQDPSVLQMVQKRYGRVPQSADYCLWSHIAEIRVQEKLGNPHDPHSSKKSAATAGKVFAGDFWGGPFPWNSRATKQPARTDVLLSVMNFLQNPLGNGWSLSLDGGARLDVIDYIPLAQPQPFTKGSDGYAAFLVQLRSEKFAQPMEQWMSLHWGHTDFQEIGMGPALVESLGTCRKNLIDEFLKPPTGADLGKKGVLAVQTGGKKDRIDVDKKWKEKVELGDGWTVKINRFLDDPKALEGELQVWLNVYGPAIEAEVWEPDGDSMGEYMFLARRPDHIYSLKKKDWVEFSSSKPGFFYHAPDVDRGSSGVKGVLHFIESADGQLYYRSFTRNEKDAKDMVLEKAGLADVENQQEFPIWQKMGWGFRILEYLPQAKRIDDYVQVNIAPGKETPQEKEMYRTMVYCRLTLPGGEKKEFWLQKGGQTRTVAVGERVFSIAYDYKVQNLGFTVKLERAETTRDPGTGSAATYSSYVQIFDPKMGINGEHRLITMNEPLEHRGYTFYQSSLEFTGFYDSNGKPVSFSGFTVGRDPGLGLKYAGSIMLALGIAIMFYMKAYFFKPRRRPAPAPTPSA